ncbi:MAG: dTDP-4-dehydrorhamnose 3,5-epimerase, partial [Clostridia bacterium]|nr:dTDP-4-dehydrorhamnose 3,5-epimerase [Clostridia bacterium]
MIEKFDFQKTELEGAYLIKPFYATDERGGFIKDYNVDTFKANGIDHELKEVFYTISHKGVIRALHFQLVKQQAKLVRCVKGHVYDVIVDLRPNSPTFGKWQGFDLSEDNRLELYIPEYFGHGYLVLEDSIVSYKCGEVFYGDGDSGIMYNDTEIGVDWPFEKIGGIENLIISEKDKNLMSFKKFLSIEQMPNAINITLDDDFLWNNKIIEQLYNNY